MHVVTFDTPMFDIAHQIFILRFRHICYVMKTALTASEGMDREQNIRCFTRISST